MRKILIGMALGAAATTAATLAADAFRTGVRPPARMAVVLYGTDEVDRDLPDYRLEHTKFGEQLAKCKGIELLFLSSAYSPGGPRIAVILDELNDVQQECIKDQMESDSVDWHFEKVSSPIEIGLNV